MEKDNDFSWNIGDLKIKIPIVQGGMGVGVSAAHLASAVANEGGVGTIAAVGLYCVNYENKISNAEAISREIRKTKQMTNGIIGVNIMFALTEFEEVVQAAIEEEVDIIFAGAGLPLDLPALKKSDSKTKLVPIVSSGKAARILTKWWNDKYNYIPDAFVVEGPLAGGHLGFKPKEIDDPRFSLENLVVQVLEVSKDIYEKYGKTVPVIAGGGIYDGKDIKKFLDLGASAVQMGTRFVATEECDAGYEFKKMYLDCKEEDIIIIKSPVGMPGRAIKNEFIEKIESQEKTPTKCPFHCIKTCEMEKSPYCISTALVSAFRGKFDTGFAFVGANGHRVNKIVTVKQLVDELVSELSELS